MSDSDETLKAARATLNRSSRRDAESSLGDAAVRGATVGAVASLVLPFVGLIGGALVGASVAAYNKLRD